MWRCCLRDVFASEFITSHSLAVTLEVEMLKPLQNGLLERGIFLKINENILLACN